MAAASLPLVNGDLQIPLDATSSAWQAVGQCRWLQNGGPEGMPAVELECNGQGMSAALQVMKLEPPRKGGFLASARMRCDEIAEGGDVGLWLDVLQQGGPPLWGRLGLPDRDSREWQRIVAEVRPTEAVTRVDLYLILRDVKGRVRFADVGIDAIPIEIRELRALSDANGACDVRASFSESLLWEIHAEQMGNQVWAKTGEGTRIADRFVTPVNAPITVTLHGQSNHQTIEATIEATPRTETSPFDWWVADPCTRIFQDDLPPFQPLRRAVLHMARGERESFQVCLRPCAEAISSVTVSLSDFVSAIGRIPASQVKWLRVGYVWVEQPLSHPFGRRREATWWPDPLLPASSFPLDAQKVQPLWFTVHVPRGTAPGTYEGKIEVRSEDFAQLTIPVVVQVHSATIPVQGRIKTAFALMDGHLRKVYGKITPELRRAYTDFLLAHRLNPDDISRTSPPDPDELEYANTRGLNAFNILNVVPEPPPNTLWVCYAPVDAYTPQFRERFFERLDSVVPELERRGLLDKAYVYGFDERGEEYFPVIRDIFGEIKHRYPQVHALSTCRLPPGTDPLSLNIDTYVPLSSSYNHGMAKAVRERGGEVWWYVCMGPRYPYANWLLEHPLIEGRLIFWQAFSYNVEGFLYWGLNIWEREHNDSPIPAEAGPCIEWSVTTGGKYPWLNGDGVLLYPGEQGPISSMRLENIRDGLEDVDLLEQYRNQSGEEAAQALLRQVITDRTHYSRDPQLLNAARTTLLDALQKKESTER